MGDGLAGRELDAAVAEEVMGWQRITWIHDESGDDPYGFAPDVYPGYVESENRGKDCIVPAYSTDIAAAFEIVEEVRKRWDQTFDLSRLASEHPEPWTAIFSPDGFSLATGNGATPAEAICRAALKVVEAQV